MKALIEGGNVPLNYTISDDGQVVEIAWPYVFRLIGNDYKYTFLLYVLPPILVIFTSFVCASLLRNSKLKIRRVKNPNLSQTYSVLTVNIVIAVQVTLVACLTLNMFRLAFLLLGSNFHSIVKQRYPWVLNVYLFLCQFS